MFNSCKLPDCYPVSYNEVENFENPTKYTCSSGWNILSTDNSIN